MITQLRDMTSFAICNRRTASENDACVIKSSGPAIGVLRGPEVQLLSPTIEVQDPIY